MTICEVLMAEFFNYDEFLCSLSDENEKSWWSERDSNMDDEKILQRGKWWDKIWFGENLCADNPWGKWRNEIFFDTFLLDF